MKNQGVRVVAKITPQRSLVFEVVYPLREAQSSSCDSTPFRLPVLQRVRAILIVGTRHQQRDQVQKGSVSPSWAARWEPRMSISHYSLQATLFCEGTKG